MHHNIPNAQRNAGLVPLDLEKMLLKIKYQEVPKSITENLVTAPEVQVEIKKAVDTLIAMYSTLLKL